MQIKINVTTEQGTQTVTVLPVDFMTWETVTKQKIGALAAGIGMGDLLRLAYSSLTRQNLVSTSLDDWAGQVLAIEDLDDDPKATSSGA